MDRKSFRRLVRLYLSGAATTTERRWLEDYDKRLADEPVPEMASEQADGIGEEIADRIKGKIQTSDQSRGRVIGWPFYRAAGAILLAMGLGWLCYTQRDAIMDRWQPVTYTQTNVPYGKIQQLTLADGTHVTLNAGSSLRYPDEFRGSKRQVWLIGEAYFDVERQAGKPFTIDAGKLQVEVLGTRFNVEAYPGSSVEKVSVLEGKVAVQDLAGRNSPVLLTARQNVSYLVAQQSFGHMGINDTDVLAWQKGYLSFKNETFKAVAAALERRYAVRIRVASEIQDCRIYATIGNGPVQQALQALALLMQAELSGSGEEFSFSGNKCQ